MADMVFCRKLKRELPAIERPPWPGELGVRIQSEISQEAWNAWKEHAKTLINEYRLNMGTPEARTFMVEQMMAFLFEEGQSLKAEGYVPEDHE